MDELKTLYVTNRKDWRAWLAKHHQVEKEIWLIYYRKETGKLRISKAAKAYAKENNMSLSGIARVTTTKSDKKLLKESLNKKFLAGRSKFL